MPIAIIVGTRPEIIKLSPIIDGLKGSFIVHTGQHYSYNMDRLFFEELRLPEPKYKLDVGGGTNLSQVSKMLVGLEEIFLKEMPDMAIVQGDTNSTLGGALAAYKLGIKSAHVESGCRSFNTEMQEERNRIIADHISDILFTPTENTKKNLLNEGIKENKIFLVGNPSIDACKRNLKIAEKSGILKKLGLKDYVLVTAHRAENVDNKNSLESIFKGLNMIAEKITVVCPMHPRTKKNVEKFKINTGKIKIIDPIGYLEFLWLLKNSKAMLTDSGGIQEEASVLGTPCLTLRNETEWVETVECGANKIVGTDPQKIFSETMKLLKEKSEVKCPFASGATERILKIIQK